MKNYFKAVFVVFITTFVSAISLHAQLKKPSFILGAGFVYSNAMGNFGNEFSRGLGAEIRGGIGLGKTYLIASTGYAYFFGKDDNDNLPVRPFKIGLRRYILGKKIFINTDIGRATIKDKIKGTNEVHNLRGFGAGANLFGLEAAINYEGWDNTGSNGFSNSLQYKIGYNFKL